MDKKSSDFFRQIGEMVIELTNIKNVFDKIKSSYKSGSSATRTVAVNSVHSGKGVQR